MNYFVVGECDACYIEADNIKDALIKATEKVGNKISTITTTPVKKIGKDKKIKEFNYINKTGHAKRIVIYDEKEGKYPFSLWDMEHGEFCGYGQMTVEQLNEFLKEYNINERIKRSIKWVKST